MDLVDDGSILMSIKKLLNVEHDDPGFDTDIGMAINAEFMTLQQLGIGADKEGFTVLDANTVWSDFSDDKTLINTVKMYVFMKVRMIFDPPGSSIVAESYNSRIHELEFRLNVQAERIKEEQKQKEQEVTYEFDGENMVLNSTQKNQNTEEDSNEQTEIPEQPTHPESPSTFVSMPSPVSEPEQPVVHHPDPFEDHPEEQQSDDGPAYAIHGETLQLFRNIF